MVLIRLPSLKRLSTALEPKWSDSLHRIHDSALEVLAALVARLCLRVEVHRAAAPAVRRKLSHGALVTNAHVLTGVNRCEWILFETVKKFASRTLLSLNEIKIIKQ